jgi:diacylglycerol kinase family enzyme
MNAFPEVTAASALPEARIAVVVNGNAKSVNEDVISSIDQILKGGDLFVSRHISEAAEIAQIIAQRAYGTVLTGGGDGTFTVMVTEVTKACQAAGKHTPRFGLLKLGTGNALAWVVGPSPLGKKNVSADIERLHREAGSKKIHLVDVEGYLTPFAGLGADAQILADYNATKNMLAGTPLAALGRGLAGYGIAALTRSLPGYLLNNMPVVRVINTGDDAWPVDPRGVQKNRPLKHGETLYEGRARLTALSTIPYYGFGMRLFPFATTDERRMNLRLSTIGSPQFVSNLRGIWNGTYHDPRYLSDFLVDRIRIECDTPVDFQIGGDAQGTRTSIEASVSREAIELVDYYEAPDDSE